MENIKFDQFDDYNKAAFESAKALESINTKLFEQLTRKNMELVNSTVEMNNKFAALFGEVANIQDFFNAQMKLASDYNGKLVSTVKEAAEIVAASKDDYQAWFEKSVSAATSVGQGFAPAKRPAAKKAA